jgi:hypothetical protein
MIRRAQAGLKLASHTIRFSLEDMEDKGTCAEVAYDNSTKTAHIRINTRNASTDLEDTVVHELLHVLFAKHLGVAENVFRRQKKHSSLRKYSKGEEELIRVLAPLLRRALLAKKKTSSRRTGGCRHAR